MVPTEEPTSDPAIDKKKDLQIDAYNGKDNSFRNVYGRMSWNKPAPTITTRFNSLSNGRFGHPEEDRAISIREGATLQTFPKYYDFKEKTLFLSVPFVCMTRTTCTACLQACLWI